jgi:hypothetical protein
LNENQPIAFGRSGHRRAAHISGYQLPGATGGLLGGGTATQCNLATTQTLKNASYDADKPGTATAGETAIVFLNAATGARNPGGLTTTPGVAYSVYTTGTNYFATLDSVTTGCTPSPTITQSQKAVDTSVSITAYDNDGISALGTTYGAGNNLSVGSGGSATAHVQLAQSAAYKHLSGKTGKFAVFLNATNVTDWNPSQMSILFDGAVCTPYGSAGLSNAATPTALGGAVVIAAVCTGDFAVNDGSIHNLAVKYNAATGVNPGAQQTEVGIVGVDYYANTVTGAIEQGAVKDSGAAIQTMQKVLVPVD